MSDVVKLRIPSNKKLEQIREVLEEDEDWRFGRIKMDGKKPRFELPAPTSDEPDNVEIEKTFLGVVIVAQKNFYQSDEDKENGNEPKEKRALYVVRVGKYMPELMYVSPTALRNWKYFAKEVVTSDKQYYEVLCEFTAEQIKGKHYTWSKPKFAIARTLTEEELAHVLTMRELVLARVKEYENNSELDDYEEKALSVDRKRRDDDEESIPKRQRAAVEDDEDDEDEKPRKKSKKDDEDEEKPKKKSKKDDEDDEDEKPRKKSKKDDEDDEDEKPRKKSKKDDEDEKPRKKSKKDDEDDDDEDKPKSKGRAGYPDLDADDDDLADVGGKKKSKKPVDDDED